MNAMPSGIYFLEVLMPGRERKAYKLIKQ